MIPLFGRLCHGSRILSILNLLWLLFCIPVFTIGASTAAMYRVTLNMVRGEGGGVRPQLLGVVQTQFQAGRSIVPDPSDSDTAGNL